MPRVIAIDQFQQFAAINLLVDPGAVGGPIVVPNAARFIIRWQLVSGKVAHNVLGGSVGAGFNPTAALAEQFRVALTTGTNWTGLAAFLATGTLLLGVDIQDLRQPGMPLVSSTGSSTAGTSASPALPSEMAVAVTLRTTRTGPGGRGRFYIPGWATNAIAANDVVAAAAITALNVWLANVSTAFTTVSASQALILPARNAYTGSTGTQHPARSAGTLPITSMATRDNHWDSQRRRGLK